MSTLIINYDAQAQRLAFVEVDVGEGAGTDIGFGRRPFARAQFSVSELTPAGRPLTPAGAVIARIAPATSASRTNHLHRTRARSQPRETPSAQVPVAHCQAL